MNPFFRRKDISLSIVLWDISSNADNVLDVWVPFFCKHWTMEVCLFVRDPHLPLVSPLVSPFIPPFVAVLGRWKTRTIVPSAHIWYIGSGRLCVLQTSIIRLMPVPQPSRYAALYITCAMWRLWGLELCNVADETSYLIVWEFEDGRKILHGVSDSDNVLK